MNHWVANTRVRRAGAALLIVGLLLGGLPTAAWAQLPTPTPTPAPDPAIATPDPAALATPQYVPGQLLVGVRQAPAGAAGGGGATALSADAVTTADALTAEADAAGAQVADVIDVTGPADAQVTYLLTMPPGQEYAVANALVGQPGVVYAEPNWLVQTAEEPAAPAPAGAPGEAAQVDVMPGFAVDDPLYATRQWNMQRIDAARAWQMLNTTGLLPTPTEIVVAVLDTGIDTTHPDFAGKLLPGYNIVDENAGSDNIAGTADDVVNPPMRDGYGHGTHVAGIIAAALNNSIGTAGIAGGVPAIKIAPYKVLNDFGSGTIEGVATGIISATVDGARVINMSLTSSNPSMTLQAAVQFAAAQGALVVAAAGNSYGTPVLWPAHYPEAMAVAALDYNDRRSTFSSYGPEVEIAAPGGDLFNYPVFSTWSQDAIDRCNDPVTSGEGVYCTRAGTSQATPAVAGVAALIWSLDPTLTAADVRAILRDTAQPLSEQPQYVGAGKVDAAEALRRMVTASVVVRPALVITEVLASALPMTLTLALENPSLEMIDWSAQLTTAVTMTEAATVTPSAWITMTSGVNNAQVGTMAHGEPAFLTLLISPIVVTAGPLTASVQITGTRADASQVVRSVPLTLIVKLSGSDPGLQRTFVPIVYGGGSEPQVVPSKLTWLAPPSEADRTTYTLTDTASVGIALPEGIKLGNTAWPAARIFADGFVAFGPDADEVTPLPSFDPTATQCIPSLAYPSQAVFGWWTNLDPGAAGARVSSFTAADGHFVVEYKNVPAVGATNPYSVSFQIALAADGSVRLNYAKAPQFAGKPERVTVGIEASDARFYSLLGCSTPQAILGTLPHGGQSFLIKPADIY